MILDRPTVLISGVAAESRIDNAQAHAVTNSDRTTASRWCFIAGKTIRKKQRGVDPVYNVKGAVRPCILELCMLYGEGRYQRCARCRRFVNLKQDIRSGR